MTKTSKCEMRDRMRGNSVMGDRECVWEWERMRRNCEVLEAGYTAAAATAACVTRIIAFSTTHRFPVVVFVNVLVRERVPVCVAIPNSKRKEKMRVVKALSLSSSSFSYRFSHSTLLFHLLQCSVLRFVRSPPFLFFFFLFFVHSFKVFRALHVAVVAIASFLFRWLLENFPVSF